MNENDPLGVRADFPATARGAYLNSAYITPHPTSVLEAGCRFLEAKSRGPIQMEEMLEETDRARRAVATLIGALPREVGFLGSTSEGENVLSRALNLGSGDNVVVDALHYNTTYLLYQHICDTSGLEVRVAPASEGSVDPADVARLVDDRTRIVSVAWIAHQNGFRHDLRRLSDIAHATGALLYVDAIQGLGTLSLDVHAEGIDIMTAGTFKWLLGGFGSAVFFVREDLLATVPNDRFGAMHIAEQEADYRFRLFDSAKKYEYASLAFDSIYQLRAGVEYLTRIGVPRIEAHAVGLAQGLRRGLVDQGFAVLTPEGNCSTLISFLHGTDVERAKRELDDARVTVTFREHDSQTRVSPALFNTEADVNTLLGVTARWGR